MSGQRIAKVAVSAATYAADRPYDYLIPEELEGAAVPGVRVAVPFSRGNRRSEGIILALADESKLPKIKPIDRVLDDSPVLTGEQIRLALWMRERFFCKVYDAVRAMLPAGLWYDVSESGEKRRVSDKTERFISLAVEPEEALELAAGRRKKARAQASVLTLLSEIGGAPMREIRLLSGASKATVNALCGEGLLNSEEEAVYRRPEYKMGDRIPIPELNADQQAAYDGIIKLAEAKKAQAALLFGVTGSGKTAIYLKLISEYLKRGKSSILLVPEIALTPQMLYTFSSHFGDEIAVLHSRLSIGERCDEWRRVKSSAAKVVIGTRSAVFAPCENLGIIIIDEEQESSYKSESAPRYHARDVAKYRCSRSGALVLLGSATPEIESFHSARTGAYSLFRLPGRFNEMELPKTIIVDMKRELREGNGGCISSVLRRELELNLEDGSQSILFLNRRGANRFVTCVDCGFTWGCPRCSVSLTYHSAVKRHICHYCGYSRKTTDDCPECGGKLQFTGAGTQKAQEELEELFPGIKVLRMDADTVRAAGSHDAVLDRFEREKIPILLGTQMVTKGLNFPNVTLVGVLSADQSLYAGSYRAGERTFSLLAQVVGRSGRGGLPGRAVIQTFTPLNETILLAAAQNYERFYEAETILRAAQKSPPFSELTMITASCVEESRTLKCCVSMRESLKRRIASLPDTQVLGPAPHPVLRVKDKFRYHITVSSPGAGAEYRGREIRAAVSAVVCEASREKEFRGVTVHADLNPVF